MPLNEDFTVPVEPFLGTGGMVVLANPNAPTGIALPLAEVERIVRDVYKRQRWCATRPSRCAR